MIYKILVVTSFLVTAILVGVALFSTEYMFASLHGKTIESPFEMLSAYSIFSLLLSVPWVVMYLLKPTPNNNLRKLAFSFGAVLISAIYFKPIANGQDFAIGLYIIFCVICIMFLFSILYLFSKK